VTGLLGDLRSSLRALARRPAFTAGAVTALALGIGANLGLFTLVHAVVLRELPYRDSQRLLWIWSTRTDRDRAFFSLPDFRELRAETRALDAAIPVAMWSVTLTGDDRPARLIGVRIGAEAFDVLGARAAAGRLLSAADGAPGEGRVVVLGHRLWQERFGARASIVGESLILNGEPYTVVGVAPRDFELPALSTDLVIPLIADTDPLRDDRGTNFLRLLGRLAPGTGIDQARDELAAITATQRERYPDTNAKKTAPRLVPLRDEIARNWRSTLPLLYGASALVLLAACTNLANLLLARANDRRGELAVRVALGASRGRLAIERVIEGLVLALAGGVPAFLVARWCVDLVRRWPVPGWDGGGLSPSAMPRASEIAIDWRVILYGLALSLLTGLVFSLAPAVIGSRVDPIRVMTGRGSERGVEGRRVTRRLVISEIAVSLALLIGAGLLVRSLLRLEQVSPGFDPAGVLVSELSFPRATYTQPGALARFFEELSTRLTSMPGVEAVAAVNVLPLSGLNVRSDFSIEGRPPATAGEMPAGQSRWVTPGYFRAIGIPVMAGRELEPGDRAGAASVLMVDQALAARYLAGSDPLGWRLALDYTGTPLAPAQIVGIAGDVKHVSLEDEPTPTFYGPIDQASETILPFLADRMVLIVRVGTAVGSDAAIGAGDPLALAEPVRRAVAAIDPDVASGAMRTAEQALDVSLAPRRFNVILLAAFAVAGLALAAAGLYAVVSDAVAQRRRELAVRMAMGAERRDIVRLVLTDVAKLVTAGIAIGAVLATLLARALATSLFGVGSADPLTWGVVPLMLAAVALVAALVPARRASRADPLDGLRQTL
jgi:putative ABC transport system permease protein